MSCNDEAWAVFWCSLLSPLLLEEIPYGKRERYFHQLSREERLLPNGRRRCLSVRTLRRKWRQLQKDGVPGLYRRRRSDRGKPRSRYADLLARAVELKNEQPRRSDQVINRILQKEFGRQVPRSKLYRHLRREGATRRKLGVSSEKVRCRWSRDEPGTLWVGDFEHGPLVMHQVPFDQDPPLGLDRLSQPLRGRGPLLRSRGPRHPRRLAAARLGQPRGQPRTLRRQRQDHANALKLACAQLNIKLLHRPPRDPAPGGLIERFFQTCQGQLEAEVRASNVLTLDQLNQVLAAWLQTAYHRQVHSQTGQTPHDRYSQDTRIVRQVDLGTVLSFFHQRMLRKVDEDSSDVRIDGLFFAVDPRLRGDRVIVQFDPFSKLGEVQLYSPSGIHLGLGRRYQREPRNHQQPQGQKSSAEPVTPHYLDAVRSDHEALHWLARKNPARVSFCARRMAGPPTPEALCGPKEQEERIPRARNGSSKIDAGDWRSGIHFLDSWNRCELSCGGLPPA